jgi:hypothetical protein
MRLWQKIKMQKRRTSGHIRRSSTQLLYTTLACTSCSPTTLQPPSPVFSPFLLVHLCLGQRCNYICSVDNTSIGCGSPAERLATLDNGRIAHQICLRYAAQSSTAYNVCVSHVSFQGSVVKPNTYSYCHREHSGQQRRRCWYMCPV